MVVGGLGSPPEYSRGWRACGHRSRAYNSPTDPPPPLHLTSKLEIFHGHPPRRRSGPLAQPAPRGLAGHARYPPPLAADRGKNPPRPLAEAEPLVARAPVRERARVDHEP